MSTKTQSVIMPAKCTTFCLAFHHHARSIALPLTCQLWALVKNGAFNCCLLAACYSTLASF